MNSENKTNINWYPGHMAKAKKMMNENIKLVDLILEIIDARIPVSSSNPDIKQIALNKPCLVILNKSDLADVDETNKWISYFENNGFACVSIDGRKNNESKKILLAITNLMKEKKEVNQKKGIINRPFRAMVCGIPNVGKSTIINSLSNKKAAKTSNKPGVTRGKQWIRLNKDLELLDTPGLLWPKLDNELTGIHLSFIGSINDNIIDMNSLIIKLLDYINSIDDNIIPSFYGINKSNNTYEYLDLIGEKRGAKYKQNRLDYDKIYKMIIDDFRSGKIGNFTIEKVDYKNENS